MSFNQSENPSHNLTRCPCRTALQQIQWKTAFTLLLWGLALMLLQFQYVLDYAPLLPAAGIVLTFLGFYRLRSENNAMHNGYRLSLVALFVYPFYLLTVTTPLILLNWLVLSLQTLFLLYQLAVLLLLHRALCQMAQQTGQKGFGRSLLALLVWAILQQIVAYTAFAGSMLVWLAFVLFFLLCLWVIWIQTGVLFQAGYRPRTAVGTLSSGWCVGACALLTGLLLLSGTIFTVSLYY